MWLEISKLPIDNITPPKAYGFSPIESGMWGKGVVTEYDTIHYENPYFIRKIEVTKDQYDKLKQFGDLAIDNNETYFNLYYNGATNSCIDFTWQALRHAGLIPTSTWNDFSRYNQKKKKAGKFDGDLKVINNIPHVKSIPAPFPDSDLNSEKYNEIPDRTRLQKFFSQNDSVQNDENIGIATRQHDGAINNV
ncbi:hypothetical protein [Pectobacterium brasiliense]|nr:hypothetical protein [Pectobacterium brasiliense]